MATWSYSSLNLFKQCPRKYYRIRVVKDIVEPQADHLIYGTEVHKAAEEYGRDGTPIPTKYDYIKPYVDTLLKSPGTQLFEYEMGLTKELTPCEFSSPNVCIVNNHFLISSRLARSCIDGNKASHSS